MAWTVNDPWRIVNECTGWRMLRGNPSPRQRAIGRRRGTGRSISQRPYGHMAWVAWQWVTWRTCSASRGWLCSGLGGYEVSDRVVRPGRCRQGVGKGSRTMCARAAGRCSGTGTTSIGVMKHRHNDSNAANLTKMQKEIGDRGRSLRCADHHISRRVRSRVLKGVGWGLSSRDRFHFRIPVVRFGMSNHECVSDDLRVTSVRSPPRSTHATQSQGCSRRPHFMQTCTCACVAKANAPTQRTCRGLGSSVPHVCTVCNYAECMRMACRATQL